MAYNTNYVIIDKESNKIIYTSPTTDCFRDLMSTGFDDKKYGFSKGRKIEIIHEKKTMKSSEKIITAWIDYLRSIDIKIGLEVGYKEYFGGGSVTFWDKESNSYKADPKLFRKTIKEDCYVFTLDFDDYSSKAKMKFAANLVRHLYEDNLPTLIEKAIELKEKHPEDDLFEIFQIQHTFRLSSGHCLLFGRFCIKPMSVAELHKMFEDWSKQTYNNGELDLYRSLCSVRNKKVSTRYVWEENYVKPHKDMKEDGSVKEYKSLLEEAIKENS